ncbi:MAG: NTF2 fold immunity protein [Bacteroidota bacterium]
MIRKNIYLTLVIALITIPSSSFSQVQGNEVRAKKILERAERKKVKDNLNKKVKTLLTEKDAYKLSLWYAKMIYGRKRIRSQKPHNVFKVDDLYIVYGSLKKDEKGGVFEIVINLKDGAVEYLSHGK